MFLLRLFLLSCFLSVYFIFPIPEFVLQSIPNNWQPTQQSMQSYLSCTVQEPNRPCVDRYTQFVHICKRWSANEFAYFFNYHLHNRNINELHILSAYELYQYVPFQEYVNTLSGFAEHIEHLYKHIDHGKKCKQRVRHITGIDRKQFGRIVKKLHQDLQNKRKQEESTFVKTTQPSPTAMAGKLADKQEVVCKQQEKQRLCAQAQQVLTSQHEQLTTLSMTWQDMTYEESSAVAARYTARSNATEVILQGNDQWYERTYAISATARRELADRHLSADKFGMLYGNALQQVLHKELVDVVDSAAHVYGSYKHISAVRNLGALVFEFADVGREYNLNGAVVQASGLADFCWSALDCIQAIDEGIQEGAVNTVDMVLHPIQMVTNITKGVGMLAYHVGHVMYEVAELDLLMDTDYEAAQKKFDDMSHRFDLVLQALREKQKELKLRDYFKGAAAFATEWYLQARLVRGLGTLYESSQKQIPKLVSQFGEYVPDKKFLLSTAEGIEIEIAQEAQNILQRSVAVGVPMGEAVSSCLTEFLFSVEKEIIHLRQLFDCTRKGFGEFANKFIKIDYQHILGIELKVGKKGTISLGGFHHDFMGAIEKGGVFDFVNLIKGKGGCYGADIWYQGSYLKHCSFFPNTWSREKVMHKVYEAFDSFIISGVKPELVPGGKYRFIGKTLENIEIEFFITQAGKIITAYPLIK